jgi:hypothetical protein
MDGTIGATCSEGGGVEAGRGQYAEPVFLDEKLMFNGFTLKLTFGRFGVIGHRHKDIVTLNWDVGLNKL